LTSFALSLSRPLALVAVLSASSLSHVAAPTACDSTASCLAVIARAQGETQTLRATFEQVKHLKLLDDPLVSHGRMFFRRPDHVRLELIDPVQSTIVVRGRYVYIPGLPAAGVGTASLAPAAAMFMQLGAVFTGALDELHKNFEITAERSADNAVTVALVPKQQSERSVFRRMQVRFAGPDLVARKIQLDDALGDRLEVTLEDVERNADLPDSLFEPPRETGQRSE